MKIAQGRQFLVRALRNIAYLDHRLIDPLRMRLMFTIESCVFFTSVSVCSKVVWCSLAWSFVSLSCAPTPNAVEHTIPTSETYPQVVIRLEVLSLKSVSSASPPKT